MSEKCPTSVQNKEANVQNNTSNTVRTTKQILLPLRLTNEIKAAEYKNRTYYLTG